MTSTLNEKFNSQCQEAIASIILYELSDPRVRSVTITGVDVSPDRRNARIYITANKKNYDTSLDTLNNARSYIRRLLGHRLKWRIVPDIQFFLDPAIDNGHSIDKTLNKELYKLNNE